MPGLGGAYEGLRSRDPAHIPTSSQDAASAHQHGVDPAIVCTWRSTEYFYERVEKASVELIRGGFFSSAEGEDLPLKYVRAQNSRTRVP
eukprot:3189818-Amphidinium_carterae.1